MIPIIKQALLENLSTDNLGPIKLPSAFGQSVEAHLVCLDVRLADSSGFPFLPLAFAVVKELTEDVILPESTVRDLRSYTHMREVKIKTATPGLLQGQSDVPHQRGHLHYDVNNENNEVDNPCADGNTHDGNTDDTNDTSTISGNDDGNENAETMPFIVTDQSKLDELIAEQQTDPTLTNCMRQAKVGKRNYYFKSGALFHRKKIADQWVEQLILPHSRRTQVMHFAHRTLTGGHCRAHSTRARIKLHFNWPGIRKDVFHFVTQCKDCNLRMGLKKSDQVPITPIVRPTLPFVMAHADIIGPLDPPSTLGHKYCLTVVDTCTRWCWCFPLRAVTSQATCDCFVELFQNTGIF